MKRVKETSGNCEHFKMFSWKSGNIYVSSDQNPVYLLCKWDYIAQKSFHLGVISLHVCVSMLRVLMMLALMGALFSGKH